MLQVERYMEAPRCSLCGVREWNHLCERVDRLAAHREAVAMAGETAERLVARRRAATSERVARHRAKRRGGVGG